MRTLVVLGTLLATLVGRPVAADIQGVQGPDFELVARPGWVSMPDGASIHVWGYAAQAAAPHPADHQYPGPTLIVSAGATVRVTLTNALPRPTSLVFPGHLATASDPGGAPVTEIAPGETATWTFVADRPGTFLYQSGTDPELQIPMGLLGALVVRPSGAPGQAYDAPETAFDREHLFVLTELDPRLNAAVAAGNLGFDTADWQPRYFLFNGRAAPDTMADDFAAWLPHQPYAAMPWMHAGERMLVRIVGAGRDLHPFHTHGHNAWVVARDGLLLQSGPGVGPDLARSEYTVTSVPGQTLDALFEWDGAGLGWDVYGHAPGDPLRTNGQGEVVEDPASHGVPFPVGLPEDRELAFGEFYSGSPFLGGEGELPPGHVGRNEGGAFTFMWHSHAEREMVNFDLFPGGMMTMLVVLPPALPEVAP